MDATTARDLLVEVLENADLDADRVREDRVMTMLSGQWKRTIPVLFEVKDRTLSATSLFCGAPDEGHAEVYAMLLHRNEDAGPVHFALDDEGDVVVTGALPLEAVDRESLDRFLGALLTISDEMYNRVLREGFATYIDAEQRWRSSRGLPENPVSTAP